MRAHEIVRRLARAFVCVGTLPTTPASAANRGLGGNDLIDGRAGDDHLLDGGGDDQLIGGPGPDLCFPSGSLRPRDC